jgi:hypothetical protein
VPDLQKNQENYMLDLEPELLPHQPLLVCRRNLYLVQPRPMDFQNMTLMFCECIVGF